MVFDYSDDIAELYDRAQHKYRTCPTCRFNTPGVAILRDSANEGLLATVDDGTGDTDNSTDAWKGIA